MAKFNDADLFTLELKEGAKKGDRYMDLLFMLEKGTFNITSTNKKGQSFIHIAVVFGAIEIVDKLKRLGLDVNIRDKDGNTPLHVAVASTNSKMVRWLCEAGAQVNAVNKKGYAPLHVAIATGSNLDKQYLIKKGAIIDDFAIAKLHEYHTQEMQKFVFTKNQQKLNSAKNTSDVGV